MTTTLPAQENQPMSSATLPITKKETEALEIPDVEISTFLCQIPWKPNAICSPFSYTKAIEVSTEDGSIEIIAHQSPNGYNCLSMEVEALLLPDDKDAIDCLFCRRRFCSSSYQISNTQEALNVYMLEKINLIRVTHPEECEGSPLVLYTQAAGAANYHARASVFNDSYGSVDAEGKGPQQRLEEFGATFGEAKELLWTGTYENQEYSYQEIGDKALDSWMNNRFQRVCLMGDWKAVGFGLGTKQWAESALAIFDKYILVADFLDQAPESDYLLPRAELPCTSECVQTIIWEQQSEVVQTGEGYKLRALPYIDTYVYVPPLCNFSRLVFTFECSSANAEWVFPTTDARIPEDGSIEFTYSKYLINGYWKFTWSLDSTSTFVPGEMMMVHAYMDSGSSICLPILLAYGWFETPCFTSAIIKGCGLLEWNAFTGKWDIIEGGEGSAMENAWEGDERLQWMVSFKGSDFWLIPSDFAKYELGFRVAILKHGTSFSIDSSYSFSKDPACRFPFSTFGDVPDTGAILSYANVSYSLCAGYDKILPETFWGTT